MEDPKITRINDQEIEIFDPNTKGTWKIVADFRISYWGAILAVQSVMENQNIAPKEGTTVTVRTSIKTEE